MIKNGFTLVELLIVITIMGIIIIAGYPSYQSFLRETRRQDAIQEILELQIEIEEFITKNNVLPTTTNFPNKDSKNNLYSLLYTPADHNLLTYQITAMAKTGTTQVDDKVGSTSCAVLQFHSAIDGIRPYECK